MELIAVGLGIVGLGVAVVAVGRYAPTFSVSDPVEGRYVISHTGPRAVVVRRAWVEDAGGTVPINSERSQVEMFDVDGYPFPPPDGPSLGEGCELQPHRRYHVTMNVNRSVVIEYRGLWLSRVSVKGEPADQRGAMTSGVCRPARQRLHNNQSMIGGLGRFSNRPGPRCHD